MKFNFPYNGLVALEFTLFGFTFFFRNKSGRSFGWAHRFKVVKEA